MRRPGKVHAQHRKKAQGGGGWENEQTPSRVISAPANLEGPGGKRTTGQNGHCPTSIQLDGESDAGGPGGHYPGPSEECAREGNRPGRSRTTWGAYIFKTQDTRAQEPTWPA